MRYVCVEITIVLTIFWVRAPLAANNETDKNEEHQSILEVNGSTVTSHYHKLVKRCWSKVISGRPILAKVVVAGSFFVLFALGAGVGLFFYIYFRHKDAFAEIEEELVSGARHYKPQLEDTRSGLHEKHVSKRGWWEKLSGKKRKRTSDEEAPEDENHQMHGEDRSKNMAQRKATGDDGEDHHKEKLKLTKKGEKSKKSDPKKKNKKSPQANRNLKKKGKSDQPNHRRKEAGEKPEDKATGETLEDLWNIRMQEVGRSKEEETVIDQKVRSQEIGGCRQSNLVEEQSPHNCPKSRYSKQSQGSVQE